MLHKVVQTAPSVIFIVVINGKANLHLGVAGFLIVLHLYHQSVEIDDQGVDRYASAGETSYLNSYQIRAGSFPLGTDVMEFRFGSIWQGHGAGLTDAALESGEMIHAWFSEGYPTGGLRYFNRAAEKDGSGFSYCAVANLFGGNSGPARDVYLEVRE